MTEREYNDRKRESGRVSGNTPPANNMLWLVLVGVYVLVLVSWTLYFDIDLKNIRNALDLVAIKGALGVALGGFISAWMNFSEKSIGNAALKFFVLGQLPGVYVSLLLRVSVSVEK